MSCAHRYLALSRTRKKDMPEIERLINEGNKGQ